MLHKVGSILVKLVEQRTTMIFRKAFETPLQDAATIWVSRQVIDMATEGLEEVREVIRRYVLDETLDDLRIKVSNSGW